MAKLMRLQRPRNHPSVLSDELVMCVASAQCGGSGLPTRLSVEKRLRDGVLLAIARELCVPYL